MATTAKKTPAKTADKTTKKPEERGTRPPDSTPADPVHPDVPAGRSAAEPNTTGAGVPKAGGSDGAPVDSRMTMIGANADPGTEGAQPGSAGYDVDAIRKEDYVYSHAAAMALPEVDSGTPVKAPSEAEVDKLHAKAEKDAKDKQRERNKDLEGDKKVDVDTVTVARQVPIVAWKEDDGRTMLLTKGKGGLAKVAAKPKAQAEA